MVGNDVAPIKSGIIPPQINLEEGQGSNPQDEIVVNRKDTVLETEEQLTSFLNQQSRFKIDEEAIRSHLEKFIKNADLKDDSYYPGEIKVFMYKTATRDVNRLIAAGTKVLDALIYSSIADNPDAARIFEITVIPDLRSNTAAKNTVDATKAIQSALVFCFIKGTLPPNSGTDTRPVPKFIKDFIYKGEVDSIVSIGKQLSSAPTMKFPSRVFLKVSPDILPTPLAARCKLSIAGNKAIRYAVYSGGFEASRKVELTKDDTPAEEWELYMRKNEKSERARNIVLFLRGLSGNWRAQLRMHPLCPTRPVVKNLTLKLIRAILESLSPIGRVSMIRKIDDDDVKSFKADKNFYGAVMSGVHVWTVLSNSDADFNDITVEQLKSYYGLL